MKIGMLSAVGLLGFGLVAACGSSTSSATVSAMSITPDPCAVARTASIQMTATATLPDGAKKDVTALSSWSTGDSNTATVSGSGVLVGVNGGVTKVSAEYQGATGSIDCTVSP